MACVYSDFATVDGGGVGSRGDQDEQVNACCLL